MLPLLLQPPPITPVAAATYATKVLALNRPHLVAYWPLWEGSGSVAVDLNGNARNGAYSACTLGQTGAGDGRTAPTFNGTSSVCNIYSVPLRTAFSGTAGTMMAWLKVSGVGVWTDATNRYPLRFAADGSNQIDFRKSSASNTFTFETTFGGVVKSVSKTSFSSTVWFHVALTWDKAADQVIGYYNGVQNGATLTGLGTWAGLLASNTALIGASITTPSGLWPGSIAHCALWDVALTAGNIATLATMP